jgi:hypothetical protein
MKAILLALTTGCLLFATVTLLATASAGPVGGACEGAVSVDCTDTYGCNSWEPGCPNEQTRHCTVWYAYFDITGPEYGNTLCHDSPYA